MIFSSLDGKEDGIMETFSQVNLLLFVSFIRHASEEMIALANSGSGSIR